MTAAPPSPSAVSSSPRRSRKAFAWLLAAGALGAAAIVALIWNLSADRDDLMARATLVVPAPLWRRSGSFFGDGLLNANYRWLNNHEILHLELREAKRNYVLVVLNTARSGRVERRTVSAAPELAAGDLLPVSLSPNGEWLLCENLRSTPPRCYCLIALDGSKRRRDWSGPGPEFGSAGAIWFADSRRFLSVPFDYPKNEYAARVYSADSPGVSQRVRLPGAGKDASVPGGALPTGRFIGGRGGASGGGQHTALPVLEYGLGPGAAPPRVVNLVAPVTQRLPRGATSPIFFQNRTFYVSPSGERILWVICTEYTVAVSAPIAGGGAAGAWLKGVLSGVFPRMFLQPNNSRARCEVFATRRDGRGGVHRLGFVMKYGRGVSPRYIGDWAWTPDEKRVSFTCDQDLYTVPVDGP